MASRRQTALAADEWTSGPALHAGENSLSIGGGEFLFAEDHAARGPRSVLWVVEVTMSATGTGWMQARGHQSRNVRHIHEQDRFDRVGDLAEAREIERRG